MNLTSVSTGVIEHLLPGPWLQALEPTHCCVGVMRAAVSDGMRRETVRPMLRLSSSEPPLQDAHGRDAQLIPQRDIGFRYKPEIFGDQSPRPYSPAHGGEQPAPG